MIKDHAQGNRQTNPLILIDSGLTNRNKEKEEEEKGMNRREGKTKRGDHN